MSQHWDEYWQQGHLTSFGDSFKGNYSGVLESVWHDEFDLLPDEFSVLDLATGNGAIPLLLNRYFSTSDKHGNVEGVDLAKISTTIDEQALNDNVKVVLTSHIDCGALPCADDSFDLVVSQFGIEYSDLSQSIPQALRVLKKGGRLSIVTHHSQSMIIARNRKILDLTSHSAVEQVLDIMDNLVLQMGSVSDATQLQRVKQDSHCEALRHSLNECISTLVALDEESLKDSELLNYVATLFQQGLFWPVEKKREYIAFARQQMNTLKSRLTELVNAALDELAISDLLTKLNVHGATLKSIVEVRDNDAGLLGWKIVINKTL